jgi:hypothetical protein
VADDPEGSRVLSEALALRERVHEHLISTRTLLDYLAVIERVQRAGAAAVA